MGFNRILTIDFETFYDSKEYTLRKMTTEEYVRDARFIAHGLCVHELGSDEPTQWISGKGIDAWVASVDWANTAVLAHNAQFDIAILSWRYGVQPVFIFDTLSMARAVRGVDVSNSLAKLATDFGLPDKGAALHKTDGLLTLPAHVEAELADYCAHDVYLCEQIFQRLSVGYPKSELRLIDLTIKMYTRPLLELDPDMLTDALLTEKEQREALLNRLGVSEKDLASNPKFAEALMRLGVSPPMKKKKPTVKTPNPVGDTLALAKNDALFQALLNGANEDVASLCEARLKVKSTTERTRAQRFLDISNRGRLPVPLSYYGALSGRWTAAKGSAINMQNLKRGSFLRKAIMAPEGYVLAVGDLSQIEPRVLAWLSDYDELLNSFRSKGDVYARFGAQMFNIPGMTKESHPSLRQSAKSALLGCFGSETKVLTPRGWVDIVSVQVTDTVWDGEEWVKHQGVIPQGEKEVLTALGISATSDHAILTEHGWVEWLGVLANPSLLKSALSSANSPVLDGSVALKGLSGKVSSATSQKCGVFVDGKGLLIPLKQRMQTYDIAFAGPRNRYTILTSRGPLIVHNCGYSLGWASFASQLLTGFMGAPPVRYDRAFAKALGVTPEYIERFLDWDDNIVQMQDIPHTCTKQELMVHCLAAKKIIEAYRAAAAPVVDFWNMCGQLIPKSLADGEEYRHKCLLFRKEEIVLPNGMSLRYPNLRQKKDEKGRLQWVYGPDATKLYPGKVTNNVTQGTARIVMTDGMLRTAKRYPIAGTVHDEQIVVVPESESQEALAWVLEQMTVEPSYMPGIPLAADGGFNRRYGLAKN